MTNPTQPDNKQLEQYTRVRASCDHSKLTETLGSTTCCYCTKMMSVLCERNNLTHSQFRDAFLDYTWSQPGFIEAVTLAKLELTI